MRLPRFAAATTALPLLALGLAACSSSARSRELGVSLDKAEPHRIVSLSPTATEDLFAIGAGSQVVAVDKDSDYPANAPRTTLDPITPNVEAILKYSPDLVVASQDSNGLVAALKKVGVTTLIEPAANTLNDAYTQIEQLGKASGHVTSADSTVATMKSAIETAVTQAGSKHADLSYYWELDPTHYSASSSTFIGQIVGSVRAEEHRGQGRQGRRRRISAAVERIHRPVLAEHRLPGRHEVLRRERGERGCAAGLVEHRGGEGGRRRGPRR